MGSLIKLIILFYLLSLVFSMFIALFRFFIDVAKWHLPEKKVKITKSIERGENNGRKYNIRGNGDTDGDTDRCRTGDTDGDTDGSRTGVTDGSGNGEQRNAIVF